MAGLSLSDLAVFNDYLPEPDRRRLYEQMLSDRSATGIQTIDPGQRWSLDQMVFMPSDLMSYRMSPQRWAEDI